MAKIDNALTKAGNLKASVHKDVKGQVAGLIESNLGFELTPNGSFAKAIATVTDDNGNEKTVYARVDYVVTLTDPFVKREAPKKSATKIDEPVEVPTLF